jgi:hypothetical protein
MAGRHNIKRKRAERTAHHRAAEVVDARTLRAHLLTTDALADGRHASRFRLRYRGHRDLDVRPMNEQDRELLMLLGGVGNRVAEMVTGLFEDTLPPDEQIALGHQLVELAGGFRQRTLRTPIIASKWSGVD